MLVKKPIDWNDLEVNRKHNSSLLTKKDWYVLIGVALFLILAAIGFFYLINNWYE